MVSSELTIVITTFKSDKVIEECLSSIGNKYRVIIIENSGDLNFKRKIESKYTNVECFLTGSNLGYAKANNLGLEKVKTKYLLPIGSDDYLIDTTNLPNTVESLDQDDYSVGCNFKSSFIYGSKLVEDKTNIELKGDLRSRFCKFLLHVGANSRYYGIIKTQIFINNYPKISYFGDDVALSAKILSFGNWLYDEKIILHRERGLSSNPHKLKEVLGYKLIPPMRFAREIVEYSSSKWSITFWLCFFIYITKILIGPIRHFWTSRIYE